MSPLASQPRVCVWLDASHPLHLPLCSKSTVREYLLPSVVQEIGDNLGSIVDIISLALGNEESEEVQQQKISDCLESKMNRFYAGYCLIGGSSEAKVLSELQSVFGSFISRLGRHIVLHILKTALWGASEGASIEVRFSSPCVDSQCVDLRRVDSDTLDSQLQELLAGWAYVRAPPFSLDCLPCPTNVSCLVLLVSGSSVTKESVKRFLGIVPSTPTFSLWCFIYGVCPEEARRSSSAEPGKGPVSELARACRKSVGHCWYMPRPPDAGQVLISELMDCCVVQLPEADIPSTLPPADSNEDASPESGAGCVASPERAGFAHEDQEEMTATTERVAQVAPIRFGPPAAVEEATFDVPPPPPSQDPNAHEEDPWGSEAPGVDYDDDVLRLIHLGMMSQAGICVPSIILGPNSQTPSQSAPPDAPTTTTLPENGSESPSTDRLLQQIALAEPRWQSILAVRQSRPLLSHKGSGSSQRSTESLRNGVPRTVPTPPPPAAPKSSPLLSVQRQPFLVESIKERIGTVFSGVATDPHIRESHNERFGLVCSIEAIVESLSSSLEALCGQTPHHAHASLLDTQTWLAEIQRRIPRVRSAWLVGGAPTLVKLVDVLHDFVAVAQSAVYEAFEVDAEMTVLASRLRLLGRNMGTDKGPLTRDSERKTRETAIRLSGVRAKIEHAKELTAVAKSYLINMAAM